MTDSFRVLSRDINITDLANDNELNIDAYESNGRKSVTLNLPNLSKDASFADRLSALHDQLLSAQTNFVIPAKRHFVQVICQMLKEDDELSKHLADFSFSPYDYEENNLFSNLIAQLQNTDIPDSLKNKLTLSLNQIFINYETRFDEIKECKTAQQAVQQGNNIYQLFREQFDSSILSEAKIISVHALTGQIDLESFLSAFSRLDVRFENSLLELLNKSNAQIDDITRRNFIGSFRTELFQIAYSVILEYFEIAAYDDLNFTASRQLHRFANSPALLELASDKLLSTEDTNNENLLFLKRLVNFAQFSSDESSKHFTDRLTELRQVNRAVLSLRSKQELELNDLQAERDQALIESIESIVHGNDDEVARLRLRTVQARIIYAQTAAAHPIHPAQIEEENALLMLEDQKQMQNALAFANRFKQQGIEFITEAGTALPRFKLSRSMSLQQFASSLMPGSSEDSNRERKRFIEEIVASNLHLFTPKEHFENQRFEFEQLLAGTTIAVPSLAFSQRYLKVATTSSTREIKRAIAWLEEPLTKKGFSIALNDFQEAVLIVRPDQCEGSLPTVGDLLKLVFPNTNFTTLSPEHQEWLRKRGLENDISAAIKPGTFISLNYTTLGALLNRLLKKLEQRELTRINEENLKLELLAKGIELVGSRCVRLLKAFEKKELEEILEAKLNVELSQLSAGTVLTKDRGYFVFDESLTINTGKKQAAFLKHSTADSAQLRASNKTFTDEEQSSLISASREVGKALVCQHAAYNLAIVNKTTALLPLLAMQALDGADRNLLEATSSILKLVADLEKQLLQVEELGKDELADELVQAKRKLLENRAKAFSMVAQFVAATGHNELSASFYGQSFDAFKQIVDTYPNLNYSGALYLQLDDYVTAGIKLALSKISEPTNWKRNIAKELSEGKINQDSAYHGIRADMQPSLEVLSSLEERIEELEIELKEYLPSGGLARILKNIGVARLMLEAEVANSVGYKEESLRQCCKALSLVLGQPALSNLLWSSGEAKSYSDNSGERDPNSLFGIHSVETYSSYHLKRFEDCFLKLSAEQQQYSLELLGKCFAVAINCENEHQANLYSQLYQHLVTSLHGQNDSTFLANSRRLQATIFCAESLLSRRESTINSGYLLLQEARHKAENLLVHSDFDGELIRLEEMILNASDTKEQQKLNTERIKLASQKTFQAAILMQIEQLAVKCVLRKASLNPDEGNLVQAEEEVSRYCAFQEKKLKDVEEKYTQIIKDEKKRLKELKLTSASVRSDKQVEELFRESELGVLLEGQRVQLEAEILANRQNIIDAKLSLAVLYISSSVNESQKAVAIINDLKTSYSVELSIEQPHLTELVQSVQVVASDFDNKYKQGELLAWLKTLSVVSSNLSLLQIISSTVVSVGGGAIAGFMVAGPLGAGSGAILGFSLSPFVGAGCNLYLDWGKVQQAYQTGYSGVNNLELALYSSGMLLNILPVGLATASSINNLGGRKLFSRAVYSLVSSQPLAQAYKVGSDGLRSFATEQQFIRYVRAMTLDHFAQKVATAGGLPLAFAGATLLGTTSVFTLSNLSGDPFLTEHQRQKRFSDVRTQVAKVGGMIIAYGFLFKVLNVVKQRDPGFLDVAGIREKIFHPRRWEDWNNGVRQALLDAEIGSFRLALPQTAPGQLVRQWIDESLSLLDDASMDTRWQQANKLGLAVHLADKDVDIALNRMLRGLEVLYEANAQDRVFNQALWALENRLGKPINSTDNTWLHSLVLSKDKAVRDSAARCLVLQLKSDNNVLNDLVCICELLTQRPAEVRQSVLEALNGLKLISHGQGSPARNNYKSLVCYLVEVVSLSKSFDESQFNKTGRRSILPEYPAMQIHLNLIRHIIRQDSVESFYLLLLEDSSTQPLLKALRDLFESLPFLESRKLLDDLFNLVDSASNTPNDASEMLVRNCSSLLRLIVDDTKLVPSASVLGKILANPNCKIRSLALRFLEGIDESDFTFADIDNLLMAYENLARLPLNDGLKQARERLLSLACTPFSHLKPELTKEIANLDRRAKHRMLKLAINMLCAETELKVPSSLSEYKAVVDFSANTQTVQLNIVKVLTICAEDIKGFENYNQVLGILENFTRSENSLLAKSSKDFLTKVGQ